MKCTSAILVATLINVIAGLGIGLVDAQTGTASPLPEKLPPLAVITPANADHLIELARIEHPSPIDGAAWSPDGKIFAVGSTTGVWFYDVTALDQPPKLLQAKTAEQGEVRIIFSADGHELATHMDGVSTLWQLPSEKMIVSFASTAAMDLNADGSLLAYVSPDGYLHLWDIIKRAERSVSKAPRSFQPDEWNGEVNFSPQGNLLAVAGGDCQIFLLTAVMGKQIATLNRDYDCWGGPIAFSPDENIIAFGDRNFVHFYNVSLGKEFAVNPCCNRSAVALAFSPNGKVVVAAADEGGGQAIFDPETGDALQWQTTSNSVVTVDINTCPTSASGVTFTKDSRLMVIGTFVCLWVTDLATGEPLFTIKSLAPTLSVIQSGQSYFISEPAAFEPSQTLLSTVETTIYADAQGNATDNGMGIIRMWGIPSH